MSDSAVLRAILLILERRTPIRFADVRRIPGVASDTQAKRVLDFGCDRGLLRRLPTGGYALGVREAIADFRHGLYGGAQ